MSSSSSGSGSPPAPKKRRRQAEVESSESSDDHDTSDASSADEEDPPQPLAPAEDTVLSHAKRRRQKKKQKLTVQSPRKKRKLDDGTSDSPPSNVHAKAKAVDDPRPTKRQNSVWVGNLSFRTTRDALREFFDGVGEITRVHMPTARLGTQMQKENMGYAYVDFETPEAKARAITLSEGHLNGRKLLIKDGDDFTGRPAKPGTEASEGGGEGRPAKNTTAANGKGLPKTAQKILRAQRHPPAPTLYLGNLGFNTTEESIRELFEAHRYWRNGNKSKGVNIIKPDERDQPKRAAKSEDMWIRKIRVCTFEDSGHCKGFAFVHFTSIEHATEALANPRNHRLDGRDLVVEYGQDGGGPRNHDWKSRAPRKGSTNAPHTKQRGPRHPEREDDADVAVKATTFRSWKPDRPDHHVRLHTRRARPGAALAHAPRQSAAILPSQSEKIVF